MKRMIIGMAFVVMATLLGRCTTGIGTDGGGSEITNGKLVGLNGAPLPGRTVDAYPDMYVHGRSSVSSIKRAVTAADGTFELDIDSGTYSLYFVDTATGSGVCVREIEAGKRLGIIRLDTLGVISGTVRTTDTSQYGTPLVIYSKGVPLLLSIGTNGGKFRFESVPPGTYPLSLAEMPPTGCVPGEDCNPGGATQPGSFSSAMVRAGGTTVIDTVISLDSIGTFR